MLTSETATSLQSQESRPMPPHTGKGQAEVSDEEVLVRLRALLAVSDLEKTTARALRVTLENEFVSLLERKALIRKKIEAFLAAQASGEEEAQEAATEVEEEEVEQPAPKAKRRVFRCGSGGLAKPQRLSDALAKVVGAESMARSQVVKQLWLYIREHNLQDPQNKTKILLDDKLKTIFKPPITMFTMNKQLSKHIYADDASPAASKKRRKNSSDDDDDADEDDEDDNDEDDDRDTDYGRKGKRLGSTGAKAKTPEKKARRAPSKGADSGGEAKKARGGFAKECQLSDALAKFMNKPTATRSELTKAFWDYWKRNGLQDPSNKHFILSDATMLELIGEKRFQGFGIQKLLAKHLS